MVMFRSRRRRSTLAGAGTFASLDPQLLAEELLQLLPGVLRGLLRVRNALVAEEPVLGIRVVLELVVRPQLTKLGVHLVDLLRSVLGQEITEVSAITDGQTESRPLEQLVTMSMRFDGGAIGVMCCGRVLPDNRNNLTVYGIDGRITGRATVGGALQGKLEVVSETVNQIVVYPHNRHGAFTAMLEEFHEAIEEDRDPLASGVDGLRVVEATLAMIESARHGRTVKISPAPVPVGK